MRAPAVLTALAAITGATACGTILSLDSDDPLPASSQDAGASDAVGDAPNAKGDGGTDGASVDAAEAGSGCHFGSSECGTKQSCHPGGVCSGCISNNGDECSSFFECCDGKCATTLPHTCSSDCSTFGDPCAPNGCCLGLKCHTDKNGIDKCDLPLPDGG